MKSGVLLVSNSIIQSIIPFLLGASLAVLLHTCSEHMHNNPTDQL